MRTKSNGRKRTQRLRSLGPLLFFACNREEGKTNCLRLPRSCRRTSCRMAARKPWSVAVAISRTRHRFLKGTGPRPPHALLRRSQLPAKENLPALFFVKKDALQVKSTKCLYTGRHAHRRISVQQGSGASAYSRTTLFAQAMPLVCVACYTGTMEHRRWGAPICAYQNNNTRDSHAHIGAHLIYRLPSCHIWTASSSHTTSKQMRRLPTRPLKKSNTHIICR